MILSKDKTGQEVEGKDIPFFCLGVTQLQVATTVFRFQKISPYISQVNLQTSSGIYRKLLMIWV